MAEGVSYEPPALKIILLIEDNSDSALRFDEIFAQKTGFQVFIASDCKTALKFMRSCKPHLIFLDERLLVSNGIDFGYRFSRMKDLQDIPLLLLSEDFH